MKKTTLVIVLALVLTFAFTASAFATTGKFFAGGVNYYQWTTPTSVTYSTVTTTSASFIIKSGVGTVGLNPSNPGAHANYLANTAKCGICHSVHRAAGTGTKLLPQADATCAGCHTAGSTITVARISWVPANYSWVPAVDPASGLSPLGSPAWIAATDASRVAAITNKSAAGAAAATAPDGGTGLGGPHNDSLLNLIEDGLWTGVGTPPMPDYDGARYGCFTRRCHATNPHGAGTSKYKLLASKLLFNDWEPGAGHTYGGEDAVLDGMGASDAAVERFVGENASVMSTTAAGDIRVNGVIVNAGTANAHALVAGLTCGRPSNVHGGEDECHAEASYAIVDKQIHERRNAGTGLSGNPYRTDNTQGGLPGFGGNDNRTVKTGHVAGSFVATTGAGSYVPINGCTSCHDQTDSNTSSGFTFPHGQVATGVTNLHLFDGVTTATGYRSRIWSGWAANAAGTASILTSTTTAALNPGIGPGSPKAFDGQCLKCHRDATGLLGIGLTK